MSSITDVLLVTGLDEDEAVAKVNAWLTENDYRKQQLRKINLDAAGGDKVICTDLWAAAFNYLDIGGLEDAIRAAPWELPHSVVAYFNFKTDAGTWVVAPTRPGRWDTEQEGAWP